MAINNNIIRLAHKIIAAGNVPKFFAVLASDIEPLPHQIITVYHEMLRRSPLRYVLADDPGAGKTIMTGLFIKELFTRDTLSRCLIVSPGSLTEQWHDELASKFFMDFLPLTDDSPAPHFCIARLDTLARSTSLQDKVSAHSWDVIVIDEAHKLSAQVYGSKTYYTKRFHLGEMLSSAAKNLLLLTATPHNGKPKDYRQFLSLLAINDTSHAVHRLLKEDLITFKCSPLFPERRAFTARYELSHQESELYEEVTRYVRTQFDRVKTLSAKRRHSVGFALTILQRRLASSPEAICESLLRRLDTLTKKLNDARYNELLIDEYDDYTSGEIEATEDLAASYVSASRTAQELKAEIDALHTLTLKASELRASGQDRKWTELSRLLNSNTFRQYEKLIIFTEHKDTLTYLTDKIRNLLGRPEAVTAIHGRMSAAERRNAQDLFRNDPHTRILVATDAAGEGINLQCANLMINYDLPWNPNRLEQRFGRIHRIGQHNTCYMWSLVAANTREGKVFDRLLTKLETASNALGGKVFDVLGKISFGSKSLHDLIVDAIISDSPQDFDTDQINSLLYERSQGHTEISRSLVRRVAQDLSDSESHLIKGENIREFFCTALKYLRGSISEGARGIYRISYLPNEILNRDPRIRKTYERVCFEKGLHAELIMQGHPLLQAVASIIVERYPEIPTPDGRTEIERAAMNAVMKIERELGNSPQDVSATKCGYDVESVTPQGTVRRIEVKGRKQGADTVTVTANEIQFALSHAEEAILALVEVDGDNTHTRYLARPFRNQPDDSAVSVTFSIPALVRESIIL